MPHDCLGWHSVKWGEALLPQKLGFGHSTFPIISLPELILRVIPCIKIQGIASEAIICLVARIHVIHITGAFNASEEVSRYT